MYLLDTNVVSALRRPEREPRQIVTWAASVAEDELYLSALSIYEIEVGIGRLERRDQPQASRLRDWLDRRVVPGFRDRILPLDETVAARAAALQVPDSMPEADGFIAATALVHRLTLVTRNVRDFESSGVSLLNPWT